MVATSTRRPFCLLVIIAVLCQLSHGFLPQPRSSAMRSRRLADTQLQMTQTSYKAAWWKTAIASIGILSGTLAVAPMDSFAADTVKVHSR